MPEVPEGHIVVEALGRSWTVPGNVAAWPYEAGLAMEQARNLEMLRLLLTPAQHARLLSLRPTVGDGQVFVTEIFKAIRASQGESLAS